MDAELLRTARAFTSDAIIKDKLARLYDLPVGPINRFVDQIRQERPNDSIPFLDPETGGIKARVLTLFQDPGPKTRTVGGSGMLSWCNDDPSADCFCRLLKKVGIDWDLLAPWNAVPWYSAGKNSTQSFKDGRWILGRLLDLLPDLNAVLTAGSVAAQQWDALRREHTSASRLRVFPTVHPAGRGLTKGSRQTRAEGLKTLEADLASLRDFLAV